jgi:hypothetical protein
MNDSKKNMTGDELIDSLKEVNLEIKNHRADDDFEKMLAELNQKGKPAEEAEKSEASETPDAAKKSGGETKPKTATKRKPAQKTAGTQNTSAAHKPQKSQGTQNTQHSQNTQKKKKPKAVPAMAAAATATAPTVPQASAPKKRTAQNTAKKNPQQKKPKPKTPQEPPMVKNIDAVWQNPTLASGGKVSMNIKTDLRREITITVPKEKLEEPKAKKAAEKKARTKNAKKSKSANTAKTEKELTLSKEEITHKQFAIVNVMVCFAIFFGLGFFLLACDRESGFIQSENRNLADKPKLTVSSLVNGSYFEDLTTWYTDTIPGREELKPFSNAFSKLFGITLGDVKIKGSLTPAVKEELDSAAVTTEVTVNTDFSKAKTTTRKKTTATEELAEVPEDLDDGEWMGNVVVSGSGENVRAMSAFYGTFEMGKKYAETLNKYREDLGSDINIYTMNMPLSSAYYMPSNLADQFTSQHDCITNIGNNLGGIVNVDVYETLEEHKDEYIYARTDHHWMPLGAYYAGKVFAEKAYINYPDLSTYEECKIENFVGTMYAYSDYDEELNQNPDTFIYYKPSNSYTVTYYDESFENPQYGGTLFFDYASGVNCYSAILGTDDEIVEIETDVDNDRTLVIFKDSYGNALVPFLTQGFSKIYVCDFRYFEINAIDFCFDVGATDVLFAVSLSAAHTESHINAIGNIRIQNPTETATLPEEVIPGETDETADGDGNGNDD